MKPPIRLRALPLEQLGECSKAALEADVSYRWWKDFSRAAKKWLDPEASAEAEARFENEIRNHFTIKEK